MVRAVSLSHQVVGSKQPLRRFCGGKVCLGLSILQTPLMWEPSALGLPLFFCCSNHLVLFFSPFNLPSRKMLTSNVRDDQGLENFKKPNKEVRSFFSFRAAGPLHVSLQWLTMVS